MTSRQSLRPSRRWERGRLATAVALGYLLVVGAVFAFVFAVAAQPHPDASFAGVWLFVVTLPTSLLVLLDAGSGPAALAVEIVLCAVLQAAVLWFVIRGRRAAR